jgi:hypothetical protein
LPVDEVNADDVKAARAWLERLLASGDQAGTEPPAEITKPRRSRRASIAPM